MTAGLIVLVVIGAYVYRAVQRDQAQRGMPAVPSSVERKSAEFNYKSVDQGRTLFTLRASEVTQFKDHGRALLEDVWITIYGRDGKQNDNIHTRECSYDPQTGGARCQGSVQIEIDSTQSPAAGTKNSPLQLATSDLTFDRETGDASTTAPVKFTFPGGSGSGVGVDYSTRSATVTIERAIQFRLAASEKTGGLPVSASGSSLEFHRNQRMAVLNGPVTVSQGNRKLSARQVSVNFDSANRPREVLVRGQPEIRVDENGGAITVSATQFEGLLNPAGWIESISADGDVRAARKNRGAANRFSAGQVVFAMIPGRNSVKSMTATRDVTAESRQDGQTNTLRTAALRVAFAEPGSAAGHADKPAPAGIGNQYIESVETLAPATIQLANNNDSTMISARKFVAKAGRTGRIEQLYGYSGVTIDCDARVTIELLDSAGATCLGDEFPRADHSAIVIVRQLNRRRRKRFHALNVLVANAGRRWLVRVPGRASRLRKRDAQRGGAQRVCLAVLPRLGSHVPRSRHALDRIAPRNHREYYLSGGETVRSAAVLPRGTHISISADALNPPGGIQQSLELRRRHGDRTAVFIHANFRLPANEHLSRPIRAVEIHRNLPRGKLAVSLAHRHRSIQHRHALVAVKLKAASRSANRQASGFFRGCQPELNGALDGHRGTASAVIHSHAAATSARKRELYRRGCRCVSRFAIERQVAGGQLKRRILRACRRRLGRIDLDLDASLAARAAGLRIVAAFARVDIVVLFPVTAVNRDPDVFQQRPAVILELRHLGGAQGEERPSLIDRFVVELRGFSLHARRNRRHSPLCLIALHGAVHVRADHDQHNQSRGHGRPARVARRLTIAQSSRL